MAQEKKQQRRLCTSDCHHVCICDICDTDDYGEVPYKAAPDCGEVPIETAPEQERRLATAVQNAMGQAEVAQQELVDFQRQQKRLAKQRLTAEQRGQHEAETQRVANEKTDTFRRGVAEALHRAGRGGAAPAPYKGTSTAGAAAEDPALPRPGECHCTSDEYCNLQEFEKQLRRGQGPGATQKRYCGLCRKETLGEVSAVMHLLGEHHREVTAGQRQYCFPCNGWVDKKRVLSGEHEAGKTHRKCLDRHQAQGQQTGPQVETAFDVEERELINSLARASQALLAHQAKRGGLSWKIGTGYAE